MKRRGISYLYAFVAFIFLIGLGCGGEATSTVPAIQPTQIQPPIATATVTATAVVSANQQYTKFSAMHNLYSAEVPSDWSYSSAWVSSKKNGAPPDTLEFAWTSPNQHGGVVFLEFDDRHKVVAAKLGDSATIILNDYFAKDGDSVNITKNNPSPDGSIQLSWELVKNKKNGTTYIYERGSTIIVLSTFFDTAYSDAFANIFAYITSSYKVP